MHSALVTLVAASTDISVNSSVTNALPGNSVLESLASGIGHWALLAAIVGVFVGGVMWAFGHFSHNYQQSYNGRKGVIVSGLAALLIGAGPTLINFFYSSGLSVH
jgi:type IV secretory pathway VirB2 component (pilin)